MLRDNNKLLYVPRTVPYTSTKEERIVVPSSYVQTILTQMHIKYKHPLRSQMKQLFNKYFYGIGVSQLIEDMYNSCQFCNSLKKLPQESQYTASNLVERPGSYFVIDVMRRAKQKILVVRDQFSSFTSAKFIPDETHETLFDAIIELINPIRSSKEVTLRADNATAFQHLANKPSQTLKDLKIKVELGRDFNKNAVATVDKGIQELQSEIIRIQPEEIPITTAQLSQSLMMLNNRLRRNGQLSAKNIMFSRDENSEKKLNLDDNYLAREHLLTKQANNKRKNKNTQVSNDPVMFKPGQAVMLKDNPAKHKVRHLSGSFVNR